METAEGAGAAGEADEPRPRFGCASFNQDSTSLAVGTRTGYKIFSLSTVEKLECIYENAEVPDVFIVERLFSSSLVVVVSSATPQRMNIYHFKKGTEICNYSYSSNILSVKLNRQWLVVCLEESIYIHNIKDMKLIQTLVNMPPNPSGLCALSINNSNSFLAYPGSATTGEIVVYGANTLSTVAVISAHDAPLAALTFNTSATKLASASERGTVIRVFSIPEGLRLFEFRRGMKRYVSIRSLSFSLDALFLCASSNTETVHIFRLEQLEPTEGGEADTWTSYVGRMFSAASSYLPAQVCDVMSQDRAFATVHLSSSAHSSVCTLVSIQKLPRLLVVTADGQLFIYNVDLQDGGECELLSKHNFFDDHGSSEKGSESAGSEQTICPPSYAATAALPASRPITATLTGYSEDGGAKRGEVIPEHEFASGPVCLDDENEFPPIKLCRDGVGGCRGGPL
ncbi:WD repeat domain phosphoinositide-interacting protein 1 isoform X1 [Oryzias melastigma]|uniref:WD repeat domain phosphoinositide-interacting protein 1 isoform X1 n=1 Tax=Oryzias melastigma TaxID=30732 RepID=UPI000CF81CAA|nr:WD repeat domain phosphoinositide-interacting protein 1 isoform X1 [Oryzias melastigma]